MVYNPVTNQLIKKYSKEKYRQFALILKLRKKNKRRVRYINSGGFHIHSRKEMKLYPFNLIT